MIDVNMLVAACATQAHRTHCAICGDHAAGVCEGYTEVDLGVATAVLDTALSRLYQDTRSALWAAHRTVTP